MKLYKFNTTVFAYGENAEDAEEVVSWCLRNMKNRYPNMIHEVEDVEINAIEVDAVTMLEI